MLVARTALGEHLALVARSDGAPDTVIDADALATYAATVDVPDGDYVLEDVDLGDATRNVPPEQALEQFAAAGRSPLTVEEGLALFAADPTVIARNRGFSLAGSSRGDRRVPAMWVSKGRPKLGWCFMGAPHTWLGTASCAGRKAR